jgi:hypothetical protein
MSVNFTVLKCPSCQSLVDEDRCIIDSIGRGHCYICGKILFEDKPKEKVVFT